MKLNLGEDKVSMQIGVYFTKIKIKSENSISNLEQEDISKLLQKSITEGSNFDLNKELNLKTFVFDLSDVCGIIDLDEEDRCMILLNGQEIEIYTPHDRIYKVWTNWKLKQLKTDTEK